MDSNFWYLLVFPTWHRWLGRSWPKWNGHKEWKICEDKFVLQHWQRGPLRPPCLWCHGCQVGSYADGLLQFHDGTFFCLLWLTSCLVQRILQFFVMWNGFLAFRNEWYKLIWGFEGRNDGYGTDIDFMYHQKYVKDEVWVMESSDLFFKLWIKPLQKDWLKRDALLFCWILKGGCLLCSHVWHW